jgi:quercetin dioxygenase-like cupin family protein
VAYAIANQGDWTMAALFFSNALGCGAIIGFAACKRLAPSPAPRGDTDPILIAARRTTSLQEHQMESKSMSDRVTFLSAMSLYGVPFGLTLAALVQRTDSGVAALTTAEMKWASEGAYARPGMEQINLVGDPAKPGPYTLRLKFPKGYRIGPHTHPDSREITIISGVFATGHGEKFDADKLEVLPAGSFYIEPANLPRYIEIKEETVLQVSGIGPSGRRFVGQSDGTK